MSATSRGLSTGQNPSWSLTFWNQVHRYRRLVQKYWWVLVFTLSITLFMGAFYQISRPPTFLSTAALYNDLENRSVAIGGQGDANNAAGQDNYLDTQIAIITERPAIRERAEQQLQAKYPNQPVAPVTLSAKSGNSIMTLSAMGSNPLYTQRYLQAVVDSYLAYRAQTRTDSNATPLEKISGEQIPRVQKDIDADDAAIIAFQREHKLLMDRQDSGNNGLSALNQKLAALHDEYYQLSLLTPEQGLGGSGTTQRREANPNAGTGSTRPLPTGALAGGSSVEADFSNAQAQLIALKGQRDEFADDLRPTHPRMIRFQELIAAKEKEITYLLEHNREQIKQRMERIAATIKTTEAELAPEKDKEVEYNLLRAEADKLVEKKARDTATYTDLRKTLTDVTLNSEVKSDQIRRLEPASPAISVPSSWIKIMGMALMFGLASGIGILILIDRMDDRMGSIGDFQSHFAEQVLGQIPRDGSTDVNELLKPDDQRHQLVESFRNLRSTLLFMPMEGPRPKTLLITSAVPNEGKSTVSSNLALVLAAAGMKTLLIDADLRRGAIHQAFGITRDPGLTDVLGHSVNWKIAIRTTSVENLHVLPRGRNVPQPSEYLLNRNTDRLLQELYPLYDYIIIDSSPVLAADDTASLAPKIDATLFVVRMSFTSAKMTRKSLEILYDRQANIPGLILNQVDTSSPEFVYYQYSEYYHAATDGDENGGEVIGTKKRPVKPMKPPVEV